MIDISFEINGQKVNPNQMGNALEQALLSSIKDEVTQKVRSIHDPKTGERPKIKVKGRSIDSLSFEISSDATCTLTTATEWAEAALIYNIVLAVNDSSATK